MNAKRYHALSKGPKLLTCPQLRTCLGVEQRVNCTRKALNRDSKGIIDILDPQFAAAGK